MVSVFLMSFEEFFKEKTVRYRTSVSVYYKKTIRINLTMFSGPNSSTFAVRLGSTRIICDRDELQK